MASHWQRIEAQRHPYFQKNKNLTRSALTEIHNQFLKGLSGKMIEEVPNYIRYELPMISRPIFRQLYERIYNQTAPDVFAELTNQKAFGDFMGPISAYMASMDNRIGMVNATTGKKYLNAFRGASAVSNDISTIAKLMNTNIQGAYNRLRAAAIARTETVTAFNLGRRAGAIATQANILKTWVTMQDGDVRDAHENANGQQQFLDDPFVVNGELLMFPCDFTGNASASNLVNCRCSEIYSIV